MRRPERPCPHEAEAPGRSSRNGVDFGGDGALFQRHGRQNPRQGLCKRGFSASGGPNQKDIVLACRRYLHAPFCGVLPHYFRKIHVLPHRMKGALTGLAVGLSVPDKEVFGILLPAKYPQDVFQRFNAVHLRSRVVHRLQGRNLREDAPRKAAFHGKFHHGQ